MTRTGGRLNPQSAGEWAAVIPRYLGMAGVVFCIVFWAFTDRLEPLILATSGTLIGIGQGAEALASLKRPEIERGGKREP